MSSIKQNLILLKQHDYYSKILRYDCVTIQSIPIYTVPKRIKPHHYIV